MPNNLTEARAYRYNQGGSYRPGVPYKEGYCIVEVVKYNGNWPMYYQCGRKINAWVSPCFCTQHAKLDAKRRARGGA